MTRSDACINMSPNIGILRFEVLNKKLILNTILYYPWKYIKKNTKNIRIKSKEIVLIELIYREEILFLRYNIRSIWLQRLLNYLFVLSNSISIPLRWFQLVVLTLKFHNPGIFWSLCENGARYMLCFRHNEWHNGSETWLELAIIIHDLERHHQKHNHAQNLAPLWSC